MRKRDVGGGSRSRKGTAIAGVLTMLHASQFQQVQAASDGEHVGIEHSQILSISVMTEAGMPASES